MFDPPEKFAPFKLYRNIYYLNTIENAASAMEMSCVAGRNVVCQVVIIFILLSYITCYYRRD